MDSFRDEKWAHETGTFIESIDPYKHLATSHPVHRVHQDRASAWMGFTSIQKGYEHMVDFFTSFEWWKTAPHDELVDNGAYCLAQPGQIYAVYLPIRPACGSDANFDYPGACKDYTLKLEAGTYDAKWFSASTGQTVALPAVQSPEWTLPHPPAGWIGRSF